MSELPSASSTELRELTGVAKRFIEQELYDEAIQLFEVALRLDPKNLGIQLSLAEVKRLRRRPRSERSLPGLLPEQIRRDALDAKHFLGLAYLYVDKGEEKRALDYLHLAIEKDLSNPAPYKLYGRLLFERREYAKAIDQLLRAHRFNPFDREVEILLGRARHEIGDHESALTSFIDAFLLFPDADHESAEELKERIQTLKHGLGWDNERLVALFHQRQEALHLAFDRLEWHREQYREEGRRPDPERPPARRGGRIELAARLEKLDLWSDLTDEQLFRLTRAVHDEDREPSDVILEQGSESRDLFVLEQGTAVTQRKTAYGTFPVALVKAGEILGETDFLNQVPRSAETLAQSYCRLLRLDAGEVERLIASHPELGVQLYWSFWHGLAFKLRCTNEQLRSFFSSEVSAKQREQLRERQEEVAAERAAVDSAAKIQVLREQGLSSKELMALASFSKERTYPEGSLIFEEGDPGHEMFVVLEGKVMISKFIPGGGEEALAILERGDFFGEMALIDGQPRSADARAHEGPVTVITLEEATIKEVLSMDVRASLEFLQLLCRLIAKRLTESEGKLVGWKIMGGDSDSASA